MNKIFLVVGADQDGDANWDVAKTLPEAAAIAKEHSELAFDKPKVFEIELPALKITERVW